MPQLLLIDGMYLAYSSFYALQNQMTRDGVPSGMVQGFITQVEALLGSQEPTHAAVAFDSPAPTFRHEQYPLYKANRQAPPEGFLVQLPAVLEYVTQRGLTLLREGGVEADDLLAAAADHFLREYPEGQVVVASADKDLFQMVSPRIRFYHFRSRRLMDAQAVREHMGVLPEQVIDYLALMGDASDHIPGVPGIGPKGALALLERWGSVPAILASLEQVEEKYRRKIAPATALLELSRDLVTLRPERVHGLPEMLPALQPPERKALKALLDRFELKLLTERLKGVLQEPEAQPCPEAELSVTEDATGPWRWLGTLASIAEVVPRLRQAGRVALDVETTGLNLPDAGMVGLSLWDGEQGYYIPLMAPDCGEEDGDPVPDAREALACLRPLLEDPKVAKAAHNLKFDLQHLRAAGLDLDGPLEDSMLLSYLLAPNSRTHRLKDLAWGLLGRKMVTFEDLLEDGKDIRAVRSRDLAAYCVADARACWDLCETLLPRLRQEGLEGLYRQVELPLVSVLADMERRGIPVNARVLEEGAEKVRRELVSLEEEIYRLAGTRFKISSSQQLGTVLFEVLGLPAQGRTSKTKSWSTDSGALARLAHVPVVDRVMAYRSGRKVLSTYLEGLLPQIAADGRIHCHFNQAVTATGRLSSSGPNLQNIPAAPLAGVDVRQAFEAPLGKVLLSADYSQIELRLMAHCAQDRALMEVFERGGDIHGATAQRLFAGSGLSAQEMRHRAKVINFSILYGSGPYSLSQELGVPFGQAREMIDAYFETYAGVRAFMDHTITAAREEGGVRTLWGRKRALPEVLSQNRTLRENGERMAVNTVIQGSAADLMKEAMIRLEAEAAGAGLDVELLLTVHDELIWALPAEQVPLWAPRVLKGMAASSIPLRVPLVVNLKQGPTWADLTPLQGV